METQRNNIDLIFDFKGIWDLPSKCGLKILNKSDKTIVIVTELYKENPGTSIADVSASLALQVCVEFNIVPDKLVYVESSPETNSKLSFYGEKYYLVGFEFANGIFSNPVYKELAVEDLNNLF